MTTIDPADALRQALRHLRDEARWRYDHWLDYVNGDQPQKPEEEARRYGEWVGTQNAYDSIKAAAQAAGIRED